MTTGASRSRRQRTGRLFAILAVTMIVALKDRGCLGAENSVRESKNVQTSEWPQFLGPGRNGISSETGLLKSWPTGGPKILWRVEGGAGMSGLAVAVGRVLTLVQKSGRQWVLAVDAQTGADDWRKDVAPAYRNSMGDGPRATPTVVGDTVYVFTGEGVLAALNIADGGIRWQKNVPAELGGETAEYGMASSPLVVGDRVIVTSGAPGKTVVAYDIKSGERLWTAGSGPAGYSSPARLEVGGQTQVVVFAGAAALGIDPAGGKLLWRYPYETDFDCNIATPIAHQGRVFIAAGENHGCALLDVQRSADGFDVSDVWSSYGPRSVMRNEWQTSVLLDGYLFGFDNVGSAGPVTHLNCVEVATGKRVWQKARFGKGNLIAADRKLWISTMKGELVVVRATPERYEEIGRCNVIGTTRQAPALSSGRLYLRDDREIVCLDVRAGG